MFTIAGGIILALVVVASFETIVAGAFDLLTALPRIIAYVGTPTAVVWLLHQVLPDQLLIDLMAVTVCGGILFGLIYGFVKVIIGLRARLAVRRLHPAPRP